jgi:hypothetical protein
VARLFDGVDDKVTCSVGGLSAVTLASTWVAVLRRGANADGDVLSIADGSAALAANLVAFADGTLAYYGNGVGLAISDLTVTTSSGWVLIAVSKPTGTEAPTWRRYVYSTDTWTHETDDETVADGTAPGGSGTVRIGASYDATSFFNGEIAAAAIYNRILTQAEIENLAHSLGGWRDAGPAAMWVLDQSATSQAVKDWVGAANQTALTGTSVATASSPIGYGEPFIQTTPKRGQHVSAAPAVVQAAASIPAPDVSAGASVDAGLVTGTAIIPTPDVFVGDSPPTNVQPSVVVTSTTIPTPDISLGIGLHPAVLVGRAVIPTPTVSVPLNPGDDLTGPGQISFNGFKMGSGTPYRWKKLAGWFVDMPDIDNGNVPHPSAHGALSGSKYAQARRVAYEFNVRGSRDEVEQIALNLLTGLPLPEADEEVPLAIRVGEQILVGQAACLKRTVEIDKNFRIGFAPGYALWELSNPRLYSRELLSAVVADGATVDAFHAGNNTTHPLIRCPGPTLNPELVIERTLDDGSDAVVTVGFDLTVDVGEVLIVDPLRGTASIGTEDVGGTLSNSSLGIADLVLGRDVSSITYSSENGTAPSATVLWRHAYI